MYNRTLARQKKFNSRYRQVEQHEPELNDDTIMKIYDKELQSGDGLSKIWGKVNDTLASTFGSEHYRPQPETNGTIWEKQYENLPHEIHFFGNYLGPYTRLGPRLQRGDKPCNNADLAAKHHDIAYESIGNQIKSGELRDKSEINKLVRQADDIFLDALNKTKEYSSSAILRNFVAHKIIHGKEMLENYKIMDPLFFVGEKVNSDKIIEIADDIEIADEKQVGSGVLGPCHEKHVIKKKVYPCCESCSIKLGICENKPAYLLKKKILNMK